MAHSSFASVNTEPILRHMHFHNKSYGFEKMPMCVTTLNAVHDRNSYKLKQWLNQLYCTSTNTFIFNVYKKHFTNMTLVILWYYWKQFGFWMLDKSMRLKFNSLIYEDMTCWQILFFGPWRRTVKRIYQILQTIVSFDRKNEKSSY